jgi:putative sigma-54 modulation protein
MNINIKATNMELTDPIRDYVHSKIGALDKIIGDSENVNVFVEIGKESNHHNKGEVFMTEVRMRFAGKDYYVKKFETDLYAAIDATKDDILRDVKTDKRRGQTLFIRGARSLKKRIKGMKPWWPFSKKENQKLIF